MKLIDLIPVLSMNVVATHSNTSRSHSDTFLLFEAQASRNSFGWKSTHVTAPRFGSWKS